MFERSELPVAPWLASSARNRCEASTPCRGPFALGKQMKVPRASARNPRSIRYQRGTAGAV